MINTYIRTTPQGEPLVSAYLHGRAAQKGIPLAGTFELTARCNFNCKMCYVHQHIPPDQELSAEQWIDLGRAAAQNGMLFLLLTGGEPLLRPDFPEIYIALKKLGLMVSVNTNGSLIDEAIIDLFVKYPPSRVNVSLYGGSNETYHKLCGNSSYQTVTDNIRRIRSRGINVKINCSVTPDNAQDIPAIYTFGREVESPVQATTYMFPPVRINNCQYGDAPARFSAERAAYWQLVCREQYLSDQQLRQLADGVTDLDEDCGRGESGSMRCRGGSTSFWVTWDGRMLPCGMFPTEGHSVPQLGFDAAWHAVRTEARNVLLPQECSNCNKQKYCTACAASCLAESGDSRIKPQYICNMTQQLDELVRKKYGKENLV